MAWGHPPFNAYGATEGGAGLAAETSDHEGMHVYEDNVIFEVVDEQYHPVPPGGTATKSSLQQSSAGHSRSSGMN
jgi:phenylacetate-coenzyme A ligase PaaK-like adenylate-forming protein